MNHVKVNLILHILSTSQLHLETRASSIPPFIFMLWYAHRLNIAQNTCMNSALPQPPRLWCALYAFQD